MATKTPNIVPLKILVISLGFLLIGGTVFVVGALANKMQHAKICTDMTVSLSKMNLRGQMVSFVPQGGTIQLSFAESGKNSVVTIDRCTGAVQQTFTITP